MNLNDTQITILLAVAIVIAMIANIYVKKRRNDKAPLGLVVGMLSDLNKNKRLSENFHFHYQSKRFWTTKWLKNQAKINFLPREIHTSLTHAFDIAEGFNERIDEAKRYKSNTYMSAIEVDKLKEPVTKAQLELREWIQANMNNPDYHVKRKSFLGSLFGFQK